MARLCIWVKGLRQDATNITTIISKIGRDKNMYKVSFKENGKYFSFDSESQSEALKFFNFSRKLKERSEVIYKVI